jgi:hypothetical protein
MPTVLRKRGWRFFFYPNEGNEPPHIHAQKAGTDGKFWLDPRTRRIHAAYAYNLGPNELREIRSIIEDHFAELMSAWIRLRDHEQT